MRWRAGAPRGTSPPRGAPRLGGLGGCCLAAACLLAAQGLVPSRRAAPALLFRNKSPFRSFGGNVDDPDHLEYLIELRIKEIKNRIRDERLVLRDQLAPIEEKIERRKQDFFKTVDPWRQELAELEAVANKPLSGYWMKKTGIRVAGAVGVVAALKMYWDSRC